MEDKPARAIHAYHDITKIVTYAACVQKVIIPVPIINARNTQYTILFVLPRE